MTQIVVALVGNKKVPSGIFPPDSEWSKPWGQRRRVEVEASPTTTYGEIIEAALEDLCKGAAAGYRPYAISFWQPSDDDGAGLGRSSYVLAVIRQDGSADWKPWHEVSLQEAEEARARGLLAGDHQRPYAFVLPQIGNGTLPIWADLSHMLDILREVAELLQLPGGVAATYWLLRGRPKDAHEAIARHGTDWQDRGLDPYLLDEWLDNHTWDAKQIAAALACTEPEAAAILWALGFAEGEDGRWRRAVDPESETMSGVRRLLISTASPLANDPQLAEELQRRLKHLLDTGEPPPERDWDRLPWLKPKMPGTEATQSRSRRTFEKMLRRLGKSVD
jgi:hypothetical protein